MKECTSYFCVRPRKYYSLKKFIKYNTHLHTFILYILFVLQLDKF